MVVLSFSRVAVSSRGTRAIVGVAIGLATLLGTATRQRNETWTDLLSIYKDGAQKSPRKPRALSKYGFALAREKRYREALVYFQRAIAIPDPGSIERREHAARALELGDKGTMEAELRGWLQGE